MTPETPTPLSLPEIIHDPEYLPMYMDLEFQPLGLELLMSEIATMNHSTPHLQGILIVSGFEETTGTITSASQHESYRLSRPTEEKLPEIFHSIYDSLKPDSQKEFSFGKYHAKTKSLLMYPDTIALVGLAFTADVIEEMRFEATEDQILAAYFDGISNISRRVLIHELIHSCQKGLQMMHRASKLIPDPIFSAMKDYFHSRATAQEARPKLERKAEQALTIKHILPDEKILELLTIARERYRLIQARR